MPPRTRRAAREESSARRETRGEASSSRAQRERSPTPRRRRRERTPSPPLSPLPWALSTREQTARYRVLHRRKVIASKFFDPYTIQHLGLQNEVHTYLANIGWTQFANIRVPTYKAVTYEILSTLYTDYNQYENSNQPCIFFRCLGIDRTLTMAQFNAMFGFPNEGLTWIGSAFEAPVAWAQLTTQLEQDYNSSQSKSTHLRSHALRYIHRVMAHSLFGRGLSTGVVNRVELFFLWAMENHVQVNTGVWVLKHLLHVAQMPTGRICVGGLLSVIADAFGFVPLPDIHRVADGNHLVDIETLVNMRLCRHIGQGQYRLLDDAGHVIDLEAEEEDEQPFEAEHAHDPLLPEDAQFEEQMPEPQPDMGGFDTGGPSTYMPQPQPDYYTQQILERLDRLELRQSRSEELLGQSEETQRQMLAMLQRMEDRLATRK